MASLNISMSDLIRFAGGRTHDVQCVCRRCQHRWSVGRLPANIPIDAPIHVCGEARCPNCGEKGKVYICPTGQNDDR